MEKTSMITAKTLTQTIAVSTLSAALLLGTVQARADGAHGTGHGHAAQAAIGKPGKIEDVTRTIEINMFDSYYEPAFIKVRQGETVRFVVRNAGELVHEYAIGTTAMHAAHQKEMTAMMERGALEIDKINRKVMKMDMGGGKTMEHKDPNSVLLEPGKTGEVIWTFAKASALDFACNVPGHYEAGMVGNFRFQPKAVPLS